MCVSGSVGAAPTPPPDLVPLYEEKVPHALVAEAPPVRKDAIQRAVKGVNVCDRRTVAVWSV
jgi:hypothetical protein